MNVLHSTWSEYTCCLRRPHLPLWQPGGKVAPHSSFSNPCERNPHCSKRGPSGKCCVLVKGEILQLSDNWNKIWFLPIDVHMEVNQHGVRYHDISTVVSWRTCIADPASSLWSVCRQQVWTVEPAIFEWTKSDPPGEVAIHSHLCEERLQSARLNVPKLLRGHHGNAQGVT